MAYVREIEQRANIYMLFPGWEIRIVKTDLRADK